MEERIRKLVEHTVKGEMWVEPVPTEYDREDLFLSPVQMSSKRVCAYIRNQEPMVREESAFTGLLKFDGSVEGDIFNRHGHKNFDIAKKYFYNQPVDNLITFEWQHSTGDFRKLITRGITGILRDIEKSEQAHAEEKEALEFLGTQRDFCFAVIDWAKKCALRARQKAQQTENPTYRENLLRLSEGLNKVPQYPAESFYEAILSLYVCYSFIPDSIGLIDRYLYPYYTADLQSGKITKEQAKSWLQELFLMLQARISIHSDRFYRGGESHFCVGGYLPDGSDGFTDFSRLIVEALMELPTWIPQISLRWTKKTPSEVLYYMMDCERRDPNKRIAFVNDEPRLKGLQEYTGFSYEEAIEYSMIGCNELSVPGGIVFGFDPVNIARCAANTFHRRAEDICAAQSFDDFYAVFEQELFADLQEATDISEGFQKIRSRDCNLVSNIFMEGCIENAKSVTQGGLNKYTAVGLLIGIPNVLDSLSVTKQFVFDEHRVDMATWVDALHKNWQGYEDLRQEILRRGAFFGNADKCSMEVSHRFFASLKKWNTGDNYLHKKWIFGNLIGYNEHHKFFGDHTPATPDGRFAGEMLKFGIGQSEGKDRSGLPALLKSVAQCDPFAIMTGPSVTNVLLDEQLIKNDDSFAKLVKLFESYFRLGGTHFQLTYVSVKDLKKAQQEPEKYRSLRVRVSGFSDYFVFLNENLQNEIILRTTHVK